jgi:hypothetical protein
MAWWNTAEFEIKQKSKFIVSFGQTFFLPNVKSCSKPSLEVNNKDYKLLNHHFNYPGIVKWNPITITFVDLNANGDQFDTAGMLAQMLNNSGYDYPHRTGHSLGTGGGSTSTISSPEKSSTIANSFGKGLTGPADFDAASFLKQNVLIQMLTPNGEVNEKWTLVNPIIRSIKFGDLTYDSDDPVEYQIEIAYDYALYGEPA